MIPTATSARRSPPAPRRERARRSGNQIRRNTISDSLLVLPRYDIPKAAPQPLREVQLLLNSADLENERDWLPEWLAERGLDWSGRSGRRRCAKGCAALVLANNGVQLDEGALRDGERRGEAPRAGSRLRRRAAR